MKILTGALRGRVLHYAKNPHVRPTADKVRKAIMDMLAHRLERARVLELFAGTGALGLEALSNGAESAVFVEKNKAQAVKIEDNLRQLGLSERGRVIALEASEAVAELERGRQSYDIVFLDPPYGDAAGAAALRRLAGSSLVHAESLVVWECGAHETLPTGTGLWTPVKTRVYGDTQVAIYQFTGGRT